MQRKSLSLLLALLLTFSPLPAAQAAGADFSDVAPGDWFAPYVGVCVEEGLMKGVGDGCFAPDRALSLAECVVLAARLKARINNTQIPHLPEEVADIVTFSQDGTVLGNWRDVELFGTRDSDFSRLLFTFHSDVWERIDPEKPLTMTLDAAWMDWSNFDMEPDGPIVYQGVYDSEAEGYLFDGGEDFDGDLFEALTCVIDPFLNYAEETILPERSELWFFDEVCYVLEFLTDDLWAEHGDALLAQYPEEYLDAHVAEIFAAPTAWRLDLAQVIGQMAGELEPVEGAALPPDIKDPWVEKLYAAGVLNGPDGTGAFYGHTPLTRAEAAAILARILRPELRLGA